MNFQLNKLEMDSRIQRTITLKLDSFVNV